MFVCGLKRIQKPRQKKSETLFPESAVVRLVRRIQTRPLNVFVFQEEMNRGKPNWEHLSEDLHVLITVEDTHNRAKIKLQRAINEVKKLLVPAVSMGPDTSASDVRLTEPCGTTVLVCMEGGRGLSVQKVCVFASFLCFVCVRECMCKGLG